MKIVICGSKRCGKSKIFARIREQGFTWAYNETVGSDMVMIEREMPEQLVNIELWDSAGSVDYRPVLPIFFDGADGAMVVFDVNDPASFGEVAGFVTDARNWSKSRELPVAVFGTKGDLWREPGVVPEATITQVTRRLKAKYFTGSAVTSQGIETCLRHIVKRVLKQRNLWPDWRIADADELAAYIPQPSAIPQPSGMARPAGAPQA